MTPRAQELFLAYAHFCGERGVEPLIPIVKQAVINAVSGIELSAKLGADQMLQVFSDAHTSGPFACCKGDKQVFSHECLEMQTGHAGLHAVHLHQRTSRPSHLTHSMSGV